MKKILVVEDDAEITDLLKVILDDAGYDVIPSPKALPLEDITELDLDLILLDHYIEEGLGGDYCREIKTCHDTKHIPVLMVSAVTQLDKIAIDSCADAFLEKPFDINTLLEMVKKFSAKEKPG